MHVEKKQRAYRIHSLKQSPSRARGLFIICSSARGLSNPIVRLLHKVDKIFRGFKVFGEGRWKGRGSRYLHPTRLIRRKVSSSLPRPLLQLDGAPEAAPAASTRKSHPRRNFPSRGITLNKQRLNFFFRLFFSYLRDFSMDLAGLLTLII